MSVYEAVPIAPTDLSSIQVGATRETVERVLGEPVASRIVGTKVSIRIDTYEYNTGKEGNPAVLLIAPIEVLGWIIAPPTAGISGAAFEAAIKEHKSRIIITYGPDDTVLPASAARPAAFQSYVFRACGGDPYLQEWLGNRYRDGIDVPQDKVRAFMWYSLAASSGQRSAANSRDYIAKEMTPEQLAKAEKLAQEWTPDSKACEA